MMRAVAGVGQRRTSIALQGGINPACGRRSKSEDTRSSRGRFPPLLMRIMLPVGPRRTSRALSTTWSPRRKEKGIIVVESFLLFLFLVRRWGVEEEEKGVTAMGVVAWEGRRGGRRRWGVHVVLPMSPASQERIMMGIQIVNEMIDVIKAVGMEIILVRVVNVCEKVGSIATVEKVEKMAVVMVVIRRGVAVAAGVEAGIMIQITMNVDDIRTKVNPMQRVEITPEIDLTIEEAMVAGGGKKEETTTDVVAENVGLVHEMAVAILVLLALPKRIVVAAERRRMIPTLLMRTAWVDPIAYPPCPVVLKIVVPTSIVTPRTVEEAMVVVVLVAEKEEEPPLHPLFQMTSDLLVVGGTPTKEFFLLRPPPLPTP